MSTRKICFTALGIALFVVLTLALQVPVFENYYLCLGYIAMAIYLYYFGTVSGTLVGTIGVFLYCVLTGGLRGMPGWIFGNIVIGIVCGVTARHIKKNRNKLSKQIIMIVVTIISTAIGILVIKSLTEMLLYSIPFTVRVATNLFAFVADVVVLSVGFEISITGERLLEKLIEVS